MDTATSRGARLLDGNGARVTLRANAPMGAAVPPDVMSAVFHAAVLSDRMALVVIEVVGGVRTVSWTNDKAVELFGYGPQDFAGLPVEQLLPTLRGGELKLLLRRERAVSMNLPVRSASGAPLECIVKATPDRTGRLWTLRMFTVDAEQERAFKATADAHERRFATLTERSPIPTLLSEQGMRLAHVNDAFCALVGLQAEQLLGTGWLGVLHPDDLDGVLEQAAAVLDGGEGEVQARLVRVDGTARTTVIRFAHLFTPGVGAGFVGTIGDITERLAFETRLAHQATTTR